MDGGMEDEVAAMDGWWDGGKTGNDGWKVKDIRINELM